MMVKGPYSAIMNDQKSHAEGVLENKSTVQNI